MYNILFHVSGIPILEICFYFYYIGPMETKIFEKVVGRLGTELVNVIEDNVVTINNDIENNNFLTPTPAPIALETNNIQKRQLNNVNSDNLIIPENIVIGTEPLALNNINVQDILIDLVTNNNSTSLNDEYMIALRNDAKTKRKENDIIYSNNRILEHIKLALAFLPI